MIILAHRGAPGTDHHENTLPALAAAFNDDDGADGAEVDLRLTLDGVLALSHDRDLGRLSGLPLDVAGTPWAVLQAAAEERGVQLARAEQVLALAAGRRVVLELKRPPSGGAAVTRTAAAVAEAVYGLQDAGTALDVTVSSFTPALLTAVRALLPRGTGVRTALLGGPSRSATSVLRAALDDGHDEVHPHVVPLLLEPSLIDTAHRCGVAVVPWTVNRRRDVQRLERLGVDGIITDLPVRSRAGLRAVPAQAGPPAAVPEQPTASPAPRRATA